MDEETKKLLAEMKSATEALKNLGDHAKTVEEMSKRIESLERDLKETAQKSAAFNVSGLAEEFGVDAKDARKFAAAALVKGVHAKGIAGVHRIDLDKVKGYEGRDRELADQMMVKAAEFGNDTLGGVFVPADIMADFVDTLRPSDRILFDLGAKQVNLPAGTGTLTLPRKLTNTSANEVSENGTSTASDMTWESITLSPHRTSALSIQSNRLTFSVASYQSILRDDLIRSLMLKIQYAALYGNGASGSVLGLKNDPKVLTLALGGGSAGATMTMDQIADFENALMEADAALEGAGIIMHPNVIRNLRKERVAQYSGQTKGQPAYPPFGPVSLAKLQEMLGYGIKSYTSIPKNVTVGGDTDCSDVFFGRFDNMSVLTWGGVVIKTSTEATVGGVSMFQNNLMAIQSDTEYDVLIRQPKEVLVVTGVKTTAI